MVSVVEAADDFETVDSSVERVPALEVLWLVPVLLSDFDEPPNNDAASLCFSGGISTSAFSKSLVGLEVEGAAGSTCEAPFAGLGEAPEEDGRVEE